MNAMTNSSEWLNRPDPARMSELDNFNAPTFNLDPSKCPNCKSPDIELEYSGSGKQWNDLEVDIDCYFCKECGERWSD